MRTLIESNELYIPDPATLELDVTELSPGDAAAEILVRIRAPASTTSE